MQLKLPKWLVSILVLLTIAIVGCSGLQPESNASPSPDRTQAASSAETTGSPAASPEKSAKKSSANLPAQFANLPRLEGKATVELVVKGSSIVLEINGDDAPITAGNFVDLVERGVYDKSMFHRVVRDPQPFVVQGGDPQSKDASVPKDLLGTGSFIDPATSQPRYIPLEIKTKQENELIYSTTFSQGGIADVPKLTHSRGALAMARAPYPDSASSQFYIALTDLRSLDGEYAVFGYVKSGMEAVDQIAQYDEITSAKVTQGTENLKKPEADQK